MLSSLPTGMEDGVPWLLAIGLLVGIIFIIAWLGERSIDRTESDRRHALNRSAFRREMGEDGQALIEYALIVSLIALVAIIALASTGTNISHILHVIVGEV